MAANLEAPRFKRVLDPSDNPELSSLYQDIVASGFGKDVPANWFTSQGERPDLLSANWTFAQQLLIQGQVVVQVLLYFATGRRKF